MRRIRCILAAVLLLLCCGCQNASPETDDTPLPAAFTAKIAVTHGALEFEADLTVSADGTAQTALTAPEAVASLSITQNADGCRFSFLGLTLETPPAFLPDASFANLLYAAVNTLRVILFYETAVRPRPRPNRRLPDLRGDWRRPRRPPVFPSFFCRNGKGRRRPRTTGRV